MAEELKPIEEEVTKEVEQPTEEPIAAEEVATESGTPMRDKFLSNLRRKYPDAEDDEALYEAAMSGYDKEHEFGKQQREETNRLAEIMKANPDLAAVFAEIDERGLDNNPEMALINISDLLKSYLNGDITSEEYEKKKADGKKAEAEKQTKMEAQEKVFREVCEEEGLDYEETMGKIAEVLLNPMAAYEIGKEQVKALINMVNYNDDVEAARVQGRNEQIVANKRKLERRNDGVPTAASGVKAQAPTEESALSKIASRRAAANNL